MCGRETLDCSNKNNFSSGQVLNTSRISARRLKGYSRSYGYNIGQGYQEN
jgi:hypothetical protein